MIKWSQWLELFTALEANGNKTSVERKSYQNYILEVFWGSSNKLNTIVCTHKILWPNKFEK